MFPKSIRNSLVAVSLLLSLTGCLAKQYVVHPPAPTLLPATPNPLSPASESSISVPFMITVNSFQELF
jgi:hypothetical protein